MRPLESRSQGADWRRAWVSKLWECFSALLLGPWCTHVSLALRSGPPSAGAQNHMSPWGPGCLSVWLAGLSTRGPSEAAVLPSRRGFLGVVEALGGGLCGPRSAVGCERPPLLRKHGGSPTPQPLRVGAARDPKAQCQLRRLQWEDGIGGCARAPGAGMGPQGHPQGWHPSAQCRPTVGLDRGAAFPGGIQADLPPGAGLSEGLAAPRFPQMPTPRVSVWAVLFSVV